MSATHPENMNFTEGVSAGADGASHEPHESLGLTSEFIENPHESTDESSTDESYETAHSLEIEKSRISKVGQVALRATQGAIVASQLTLANEAARSAVFTATYAATKDPYMSGLAYGGATLAIESSAGLAAAGLLASDAAEKTVNKVNRLLARFGVTAEQRMGKFTEASLTFLGGTAVGTVLRYRQDPERTKEQNRKYALKSAAALAGVCAVQGYLMGKGINMPKPTTIGLAGAAFVGVYYGAKKIVNRAKGSAEKFSKVASSEHYIKKHDLAITSTDNPAEITEAAELEQRIWNENDFGDLGVYEKYNGQSQVIKANIADKCVGMTRMFKGFPELPPFVEGMTYYTDAEKEKVTALCQEGRIEELGTTAVDHAAAPEVKRSVISSNMWRLAYRDARARGVEHWGIIMEPERVEKMNKQFGFTFKQLGPTEEYQGGDCAPFMMDLQEVDKSMQKTNPVKHHWFVRMKQKRLPSQAM